MHFSRQDAFRVCTIGLLIRRGCAPMDKLPDRPLAADDPEPVTVCNENGGSPFVIVADHAGNSLSRALGRLGIPEIVLGAPHRLGHRIDAFSRRVADTLEPPWLRRTTHGS
jgi:predicted N-formylglutamate amidohydrolase